MRLETFPNLWTPDRAIFLPSFDSFLVYFLQSRVYSCSSHDRGRRAINGDGWPEESVRDEGRTISLLSSIPPGQGGGRPSPISTLSRAL